MLCAHGIPLDEERCGTCVHESGRTDERILPYTHKRSAAEEFNRRWVELNGEIPLITDVAARYAFKACQWWYVEGYNSHVAS